MLEQNERELLARIGFFLCRRGRIPEAELIFNGLAASEPTRDGPLAGLALCRIIKGENEAAVALLEPRLKAGSPIQAILMLYKLTALGTSGELAKAAAVRDEMREAGMTVELIQAEQLIAELSRLNVK
ncbi:MAG: hypothetical protein LBU64_05485 [Planctomycetota bacterium]|jgi:Flp pilus assembly protein TadD|nr:hypothetical protein [Planctomycetota bacterium]